MRAAHFTSTFLYLLGGLIFWGVRFLSVYSFTAIACSRGWQGNQFAGIGAVQLGVSLITIPGVLGGVAILVVAMSRLRTRPAGEAEENSRSIHYIAATVAALAILAMLWETLPVYMIPVCA